MKMKRIRLVHTKKWALQPVSGRQIRIGRDTYNCWFTFGHYAVIQFNHTMTWEW